MRSRYSGPAPDGPPLERHEVAAAMAYEAAEFFAYDSTRGTSHDGRTDMFGEFAVVTAVYDRRALRVSG